MSEKAISFSDNRGSMKAKLISADGAVLYTDLVSFRPSIRTVLFYRHGRDAMKFVDAGTIPDTLPDTPSREYEFEERRQQDWLDLFIYREVR